MTPVTRTVATLASSTLVVGLMTAAAASGEEPADQISGVVGGLLSPAPEKESASRDRGAYGRTSAPDGRLRKGCRNYPYRYRVTPPTDDWMLQTFLRDPRGEGIAAGAFSSDADPRAQRAHFRFCRYGTRPGRFRIRALLHWYDDGGGEHRIWLKPATFRLRPPR